MLIALLALATYGSTSADESEPRKIHVHVNQIKGPLNRAFQFSVGSDRALIHLRPEHQRYLRFLTETCDFKYMRFHGLLNEEMQVVKVDDDGALMYDWSDVDRVYDFLVRDLKIRPVVELGFMPEPLASGRQTIFWWKGNVTPPPRTQPIYELWRESANS